ncbi:MAG: 4-hydroxy-3-methylbut-2-enyl diphosphate reductase [Planctomycetota bacterium]
MKIHLAGVRGFCAGVDRAIAVVEKALERFGSPVYVRHEIVHNRTVCNDLRKKGAIFVEELSEVPDGALVIFSAHGVSRAVVNDAGERGLQTLDATCPLVTKVHMEAKALERRGWRLILIGHKGHPEVEGTMGQVDAPMTLIGTEQEVEALDWPADSQVAYVTQTTLSVDETKDIIEALKRKFPSLKTPPKEDICYATTNRQKSVKELIDDVDVLIVLGAPNSSNSRRLQELGERKGIQSYLVEGVSDIRDEWVKGAENVGVTSGASAPESLVQEVVAWLQERHGGTLATPLDRTAEHVEFPLPKALK